MDPVATHEKISRHGHRKMGGEVGQKDGGFMARKPRLFHQASHNQPHRAERTQVTGVGTVAHHQGHQKGTDPGGDGRAHGQRCHQGGGGNRARAQTGNRSGEEKKHPGKQLGSPPGPAGRHPGDVAQGSVFLGQTEKQGHPRQGQEQTGGKQPDYLVGLPVGTPNRQRPRQPQGQHPDVAAGRHAEHDHQQQGEEGKTGGSHHGLWGGRRCFCTLPKAVRGR